MGILSVSIINAQISTATKNNSNITTDINSCPQYSPPSPDWCKDGKIVGGEIDENGCQGHPTCTFSIDSGSITTSTCKVGCVCKGEITTCSIDNGGTTNQGLGTTSCKSGCVCKGKTMTCPTEDRVIINIYTDEENPTQEPTGESNTNTITVPISMTTQGDKIKIKSGKVEAVTSESISVIESKLTMQTSNGRNAEIKIMPDTASEKAIERLKLKVCSEENNCTIQLKEVGKDSKYFVAYEIDANNEVKILGMFKKKMKVQAQIDAETGEVILIKKPWWSFLAKEN